LGESPNNSIFRKNINPFRVGTIFISVLDDIQLRFAQYIYSCEQLKLTLMKQLLMVFNLYHEPNELAPILEEEDYYSRNVFYYFVKYDMMTILQTSIMDRFLTDKWLGRLHINNKIYEFSSAYELMADKFQQF